MLRIVITSEKFGTKTEELYSRKEEGRAIYKQKLINPDLDTEANGYLLIEDAPFSIEYWRIRHFETAENGHNGMEPFQVLCVGYNRYAEFFTLDDFLIRAEVIPE